MRSVFGDTFYFLALLNRDDASHQRALLFGRGTNQRPTVITTGFVLTEVADALCHHTQRATVVSFFEFLRTKRSVKIFPATEELFQAGLGLYSRRSDKDWSLTDCISFGVMREQHITEALTADKHFEQAGFVALLK